MKIFRIHIALTYGALLIITSTFAAAAQLSSTTTITVIEYRMRTVVDLMKIGQGLLESKRYLQGAMVFDKVLLLDPANPTAREYLRQCEKGISAP